MLHGYDPALDQLVETERDRDAAEAAVEFPAIDGAAGIMNCDDTPLRRMFPVNLSGADHFVIYTLGKRLDSVLLSLGFQPRLVGQCIFLLVHTVYRL